ncbi:hypothetical protein Syun_023334 [Stephania yunnanensis]|uniref:Uncharacterized protein n=1 Tax=Stephania yunnanensis TaxID=152371 RepID=A0AAP0HZH8_9MAGN
MGEKGSPELLNEKEGERVDRLSDKMGEQSCGQDEGRGGECQLLGLRELQAFFPLPPSPSSFSFPVFFLPPSITTLSTIRTILRHGDNKMSIRDVSDYRAGWRPTSSNRKKKVDQNNPQPNRKWAKQANESDLQPGEIGMEHGAATSSVGDRDGLPHGG